MRSHFAIKIGLVGFFLLASSFPGLCYLSPTFDHEYIVSTPAGRFGIGDWTESAEPPGVGYIPPGRMRTVSQIYLGDTFENFNFQLPGNASFWIWVGPILFFAPVLLLSCFWCIWKRARKLLKVLLFGAVGFYFGVILALLSGLYGGRSDLWAGIVGSPFSFIDIRLGWLFWLMAGVLLALSARRWAVWGLLICMLLHYAAIFVALVWFAPLGENIFINWPSLLNRTSAWLISYLLIYIAGQSVVWIALARRFRQKIKQTAQ
jgi:hypothetical protein